MKNLIFRMFLLVLSCSAVAAQERIIDQATYEDLMKKAGEYRLSVNYRVKSVIETCEQANCVWKPLAIEVLEFDQPNKRRSYMIDTHRGQTGPTAEFIFVDDKVYAKRPGLDWRLEEPRQREGETQSTETTKIEFKDLGPQAVGLDIKRVLVRTAHSRSSRMPDAPFSTHTIKSWIDMNGRLKKQEFILVGVGGRTTRRTMSYEVDPTIRVEVPLK